MSEQEISAMSDVQLVEQIQSQAKALDNSELHEILAKLVGAVKSRSSN